jgi:hypothetical protein
MFGTYNLKYECWVCKMCYKNYVILNGDFEPILALLCNE